MTAQCEVQDFYLTSYLACCGYCGTWIQLNWIELNWIESVCLKFIRESKDLNICIRTANFNTFFFLQSNKSVLWTQLPSIYNFDVTHEVPIVVKFEVMVFWIVLPCSLVGRYQVRWRNLFFPIFSIEELPKWGKRSNRFVRNIGTYVPDCMVSHLMRD
jgi:hypothetical protein